MEILTECISLNHKNKVSVRCESADKGRRQFMIQHRLAWNIFFFIDRRCIKINFVYENNVLDNWWIKCCVDALFWARNLFIVAYWNLFLPSINGLMCRMKRDFWLTIAWFGIRSRCEVPLHRTRINCLQYFMAEIYRVEFSENFYECEQNFWIFMRFSHATMCSVEWLARKLWLNSFLAHDSDVKKNLGTNRHLTESLAGHDFESVNLMSYFFQIKFKYNLTAFNMWNLTACLFSHHKCCLVFLSKKA